ncbi:MAG: hypothetical protein ACREQE_00765 [Candidatus Binataceae bacterium]
MARSSEFDEAMGQLLNSEDFQFQLRLGHELIRGAVLTALSEVPFEVRFKCGACGMVLWFENPSWQDGWCARWRLGSGSRAIAAMRCGAPIDQADDSIDSGPLMRS